MTSQTLLTLLGALGIPVIVTSVLKLITDRIALKAGNPKATAEAADIGIGSQAKVIATLTAENDRLAGANAKLSTKLDEATDAARQRSLEHEARVAELIVEIEDTRFDITRQVNQVRDEYRADLAAQQAEMASFRSAVADLLRANDLPLPAWWWGSPTPRGAP